MKYSQTDEDGGLGETNYDEEVEEVGERQT